MAGQKQTSHPLQDRQPLFAQKGGQKDYKTGYFHTVFFSVHVLPDAGLNSFPNGGTPAT